MFANEIRKEEADAAMNLTTEQGLGTTQGDHKDARLKRLPAGIRLMQRVSSRGLPGPVWEVRLEPGLAVPSASGGTLVADHYVPVIDESVPTILVRSPYGRGFPWSSLFGATF